MPTVMLITTMSDLYIWSLLSHKGQELTMTGCTSCLGRREHRLVLYVFPNVDIQMRMLTDDENFVIYFL